MCKYVLDMKILLSKLAMGQLYTDDINDADNDDNDNDPLQTNPDCIGSLPCMPNEPKTKNRSMGTFAHLAF